MFCTEALIMKDEGSEQTQGVISRSARHQLHRDKCFSAQKKSAMPCALRRHWLARQEIVVERRFALFATTLLAGVAFGQSIYRKPHHVAPRLGSPEGM